MIVSSILLVRTAYLLGSIPSVHPVSRWLKSLDLHHLVFDRNIASRADWIRRMPDEA